MKTNEVFWIRTDGEDASPRGPWKSLAGARDGLRALRASGELTGPAEVRVAPGRYPVEETVRFGPEDSFTRYVAEECGTAVLDGGVELDGFTETEVHGQRAWVLDLPEVQSGRWFFRSLYVDGVRRPRARLPKFRPDREGVKECFRIGEIRFPEKRVLFDGDHWFKPREGDVHDWPSLPYAEIVLLHFWIETRLPQPFLDPKTGWIRTARRSSFNLYESFDDRLARYYIDHLYEALTEPGEWYLDERSGRLTYLPTEGETLESTRLVAPRVKQLVRASGQFFNEDSEPTDPNWHRYLEELSFEGLHFMNTDWYSPPAEVLKQNIHENRQEDIPLGGSVQAAVSVPCVVEFYGSRRCGLKNCHLSRIGMGGVLIGDGSRDCEVQGNRLEGLGAGGIKVWGDDLDGAIARRTGHIRVEDNRIERIGRVFHQGVGILLGPVFDCAARHNSIRETCYTGISVGWSWGYRETISRNNRIEWNRIEQIGQGVLSDMGGIYTLGVQPGTVVRGNVIHDVESHAYGGWGIYPDEGSSHILFEDNLVTGTQGSPFRVHYGRELVVRNNVFVGSREEGLIGVGRDEDHVSVTLLHNLLIGPAPRLYEGGYAGKMEHSVESDGNLIWFQGDAVPGCGNPDGKGKPEARNLTFAQWQEAGKDTRSMVIDPLFEDEGPTGYELKPDSPAFQLGFRAVDWGRAGAAD